jgi:predicted PurR-regulated permease PerM
MQEVHAEGRQPGTPRDQETRGSDYFARSAILATGVILAVMIGLFLLWYLLHVFLLLFAGLLLATLLHIPADWISGRTSIGERWSLLLVLVVGLALLGLGGWFLAPRVGSQFDDLVQTLPNGLQPIRSFLDQYVWFQQFMGEMPSLREAISSTMENVNAFSRISRIFSGIVGLVTSLFVILFVGLYLAFQRDLYSAGLVKLFPKARREHMHDILEDLGYSLKWWLLGRVVSMVVLGVFTGVGLWLLGVPFALTLGVLSGLFSFVPIIGSILAVIPAALVALTQGPMMLLYVLLLYYGAQTIESYLLTPSVQQQAVSLPPVLAFAVQLILGVVSGALGLALAFPIAIVGMILVKRLYIQDVLGDTSVQVVNH